MTTMFANTFTVESDTPEAQAACASVNRLHNDITAIATNIRDSLLASDVPTTTEEVDGYVDTLRGMGVTRAIEVNATMGHYASFLRDVEEVTRGYVKGLADQGDPEALAWVARNRDSLGAELRDVVNGMYVAVVGPGPKGKPAVDSSLPVC